jgi:hypothetical protein
MIKKFWIYKVNFLIPILNALYTQELENEPQTFNLLKSSKFHTTTNLLLIFTSMFLFFYYHVRHGSTWCILGSVDPTSPWQNIPIIWYLNVLTPLQMTYCPHIVQFTWQTNYWIFYFFFYLTQTCVLLFQLLIGTWETHEGWPFFVIVYWNWVKKT